MALERIVFCPFRWIVELRRPEVLGFASHELPSAETLRSAYRTWERRWLGCFMWAGLDLRVEKRETHQVLERGCFFPDK